MADKLIDKIVSIEGKLTTIDSVLDNILTKNTQIDTAQDLTNTKLTTIDSVLDNIKAKTDYLDDIDSDTNAIKTDIAELEKVQKKGFGKGWKTVQGSVINDTALLTASGNEIIITFMHFHASTTCDWRVQHDRSSNRISILKMTDSTYYNFENANLVLEDGDILYLNEVSGSATLYYVVSYYEPEQ